MGEVGLLRFHLDSDSRSLVPAQSLGWRYRLVTKQRLAFSYKSPLVLHLTLPMSRAVPAPNSRSGRTSELRRLHWFVMCDVLHCRCTQASKYWEMTFGSAHARAFRQATVIYEVSFGSLAVMPFLRLLAVAIAYRPPFCWSYMSTR